MSGKRKKEARLLAKLQAARGYAIAVPPGSTGVQLDADSLAHAKSIAITIAGAEADKARELLHSVAPRLASDALIGVTLNGVPPSLLEGGLAALVEAVERDGYSVVDLLTGADMILLALRHASTLDAGEMTVWIEHAGQDVSLIYPDSRDLLRRMAVVSHRFYEADLLDHIAARHRGATIVDAGANIGNHAVFLAKFAGAMVHAFEPAPDTFTCLAANVEANGLSERIRCNRIALGAEIGQGRVIAAPAGNLGAARFEPMADGAVPMTTLDIALADAGRIDVIKIDVEGMEGEVLRGGESIITRHRPDLFVEILDRARLDGITGWLAGFGYRRLRSHTGNPTWEFVARE